MNVFETIRTRRTVRSYLPTPIGEECLRRVLEAANAAPSAGNLQSYEIYVVTGKRKREQLGRAANEQMFVGCAPAALVFCMNRARSAERYGRRARLYSMQDATIACAFAMLAATGLGLGSAWIGAFDPGEVRAIIGAPKHILPIAILPLGHASERPDFPGRRPLEELAHRVE